MPGPKDALALEGGLYTLFMLGALALGLWPGALHPMAGSGTTLPALRIVAAGQAVFIVLIHPALLARRSGNLYRLWALHLAIMLSVSVPFLVVSAYVSDAVAVDVVRVTIYGLFLWLIVPASATLIRAGGLRTTLSMLVLVIMGAGLPAAWYIMMDFSRWRHAEVFRFASSVMFAFDNAASRGHVFGGLPLWSALLPVAVALGFVVVEKALGGEYRHGGSTAC